MFLSLLLLISICPDFLSAQESSRVTGIVTDRETGKPIPTVNVLVRGTNIGTSSDSSGAFLILVPLRERIVLVCSHVGYNEVSRAVYIEKPKELVLNIEMEPRLIPLNEVDVKSGRRKDERWPDYVLRADDIQRSGEAEFKRALHYLVPDVFPRTAYAWFGSLDRFIFYVDSTQCEPEYLDDLDPKVVKRIRVWDNRWGITPMGLPSLLRTRYVVSIETK